MNEIVLKRRRIGKGHPTYVIAEIGINHNGSVTLAKELIEKSARAGVDAVKLQKRDADSIMIKSHLNANPVGRLSQSANDIVEGGPAFGNWSYPDIRLELKDEAYPVLKKFSDDLGVDFFASPWDKKSIDFLVDLGVEILKAPSVEIRNPVYINDIARAGLPIILSTGTATQADVDRAVAQITKINPKLIVLQCTSAYPSVMTEIDLHVIQTFRDRYHLPIGFSGHEPGVHIPVAAVALGACVIEKHVTLDRRMNGPDHGASINMEELAEMVRQIRDVEKALGTPDKKHYDTEKVLESVLGKSVVSLTRIPSGSILKAEMLTAKGPNRGIPAEKIFELVGKKAVLDIPEDSLILPEHIQA